MESSHVHTRWLRLRDRFGDRGLVSLVIAHEVEDSIEVDTWLMSCRVLNRTVEHCLFTVFDTLAVERKLARLVGHYIPSAKNSPARDHYERLGFTLVAETDGGSRWQRVAGGGWPRSFVRLGR
jgi:predicted enzyme involved in methoxymalonyl-ACP biosynthesis